MASQDTAHDGHLDATAGREVVFCHACSHEWYRDQHGLTCPSCHGDITEIIDPGNDPRDLGHRSSASTSPELPPLHDIDDDDSDPDEADITEQLGPHGFAFRRSVRDGPDHHHHHNPAVDPVLERFLNMVQGFGPPRRPTGGPPFAPNQAGQAPNQPSQESFMQPHIHRTTFTSGTFGGGTTSVTIVSGPLHGGQAGASPGGPGPDPFQTIFSNIVQDIGRPEDPNRAEAENFAGVPVPAFARSLHDILNLLNPGNAMAGDAVYSQEALDRIITGLMEANPQSNAAPPATEAALQNLPRKPVDKEMLGNDDKTECTICIDEMKEGETVIFLPCKHWFHEACVVLWLKEHNTCPICRTPIEKNDRGNNSNNSRGGGNPSAGQSSARPSHFPAPPGVYPTSSGWMTAFGDSSETSDGGQTRSTRLTRSPNHTPSFHDAFSSTPLSQRERERNRDRGTTSGFSYDTSRLQRRSSHSPTSPRAAGPEEHAARMRQRSPSQSSRRSTSDRDQRRQSGGHGPISWLRDQFSRGGPGSGSSRDGRRQ